MPTPLTFKKNTYSDNRTHLLAYDGPSLVGLIEYTPTEDGNVVLNAIQVTSKYRGSGFGRLLVEKLEKDLKKEHFKYIFLEDVFGDAAGFWSRLGYHPPSSGMGWRKPL